MPPRGDADEREEGESTLKRLKTPLRGQEWREDVRGMLALKNVGGGGWDREKEVNATLTRKREKGVA